MIPLNPEPPSRQTMAELPSRAAVFLRTAVTVPQIRVRLAAAGYDEDAHREGLELLGRVLAWGGSVDGVVDDLAAQDALGQIHDFIERHLPRLALGAARVLPGDASAVFGGLQRLAERQPVLAFATLLERIEQLPDGAPLRRFLARRGVGNAERARLAALLATVQSSADPAQGDLAAHRDPRTDAHTRLWAWLRDWSFTARSVIRRRDHLIALGLSGRRRRKDWRDGGLQAAAGGAVNPPENGAADNAVSSTANRAVSAADNAVSSTANGAVGAAGAEG